MEPFTTVMQPQLPDTTKIQKYTFKNGRFYKDTLIFKKISFELLNGYPYENGDIYKGTIRNGEFYGKLKNKVYVYKGSFKFWLPDGDGEVEFINHSRYAGEFKNGNLNGKGAYTYMRGSLFEGTIRNGKLLSGTFKFSNGSIYEGSFSNHKFEGLGTMLYSNGSRYEGLWKNHKRHGWGQMIYHEGGKEVRIYEGFWEDDSECHFDMTCEKLA